MRVAQGLISALLRCNGRVHSVTHLCKRANHILIHTDDKGHKWHVACSVFLQRLPILTPPMTPLQEKYSKTRKTMEDEMSLRSLHEVRAIAETTLRQQKNEENNVCGEIATGPGRRGRVEDTSSITLTVSEEEDLWEKSLQEFSQSVAFKNACTTDDNNLQNPMRHMRSTVTYVIKDPFNETQWLLPWIQLSHETSLHQAAKEILQNNFENIGDIKLCSTVPFTSHTVHVKPSVRQKLDGALGWKVFIMRAIWNGVNLNPTQSDYAWFTQNELKSYLNISYVQSLNAARL